MKKLLQVIFVLLCLFFLGCATANVFAVKEIIADENTQILVQILFYSSAAALGLFCLGVALKSHFDKNK